MVRIVEIIGGLGNQMFQYAFFLYLKNKSHIWDRLYVDIEAMKTYDRHYGLELEKVFNLSLCPISNRLHRNLQKRSFAKHFVSILSVNLMNLFIVDCVHIVIIAVIGRMRVIL